MLDLCCKKSSNEGKTTSSFIRELYYSPGSTRYCEIGDLHCVLGFFNLKGEIAATNVLSNIRQNNFTGHKYHAGSYETWLGGFGEKMHPEVPFTAWGRNIFCQEASPGRLGFIFLALSIFKLFVICISWLCSLCYVYMEPSRATDSIFFKLICLTD